MMLYEALKTIYPDIPDSAFSLQDDGAGPYIKQWDYNQPRPSQSAIDAANQAATTQAMIDAATERIDSAYSAAFADIRKQYPEEERESWATQIIEASAWTASNGAATPWVDAAASARGIPKAALIAKIKARAAAYQAYSGQQTGKRQKLFDQIDALGPSPTQAQLDAIQW